MIKKTIFQLFMALAVLGFIFLANGLILAWDTPTAPPPGDNVSAPINVGTDNQTFEGSKVLEFTNPADVLWVDGALTVGGLLYNAAGRTSIGVETPETGVNLHVAEEDDGIVKIGTDDGSNAELCLNDECFTGADLLAAGSGGTIVGFVGFTPISYTGDLNGLSGAAQTCAGEFGAGTRMCTCEAVTNTDQSAWCYGPFWYLGSDFVNNCKNYTDGTYTAFNRIRGNLSKGSGRCNIGYPIACCGQVVVTPGVPNPPTNLSAIQDGSDVPYARLNWTDNSTDEQGFKIYQNAEQICAVGPDVQLADRNNCSSLGQVPYGGLHTFEVTAYNTNGESDPTTNTVTLSCTVSAGTPGIDGIDNDCDEVVDEEDMVSERWYYLGASYAVGETIPCPVDPWPGQYSSVNNYRVAGHFDFDYFADLASCLAYTDPADCTNPETVWNGWGSPPFTVPSSANWLVGCAKCFDCDLTAGCHNVCPGGCACGGCQAYSPDPDGLHDAKCKYEVYLYDAVAD